MKIIFGLTIGFIVMAFLAVGLFRMMLEKLY